MDKKKRAIGLMIIASHRHKNYLESRLAANSLEIYPAQHRILMIINMMPGISQKELAKVLQVSPATITISVKKLIKAGYLVKTNCSEDNRCNILAITDTGKEIVDKSGALFTSIDQEMFAGFSDHEMDAMINYFERVLDNINKVDPQENSSEHLKCNMDVLFEKEREEK